MQVYVYIYMSLFWGCETRTAFRRFFYLIRTPHQIYYALTIPPPKLIDKGLRGRSRDDPQMASRRLPRFQSSQS